MSGFFENIKSGKLISDYKLIKKYVKLNNKSSKKSYQLGGADDEKPEIQSNSLQEKDIKKTDKASDINDVGEDKAPVDLGELPPADPTKSGWAEAGIPINEIIAKSGKLPMSGEEARQKITTIPYMEPTHKTLYTIPKGTVLYHGSMNRETFDPANIRLGDDFLVSFFSQEKRFALDYIAGCSLHPEKTGWIHKFIVTKDIDKVYIISPYARANEWNLKDIENKYCRGISGDRYNGVGFFLVSDDQKNTVSDGERSPESVFSAEFAICNPTEFLQYIDTQRCVNIRKLSDPYSFDR